MPTFTVKEIVQARPWSKTAGEPPTRVYYDFTAEETPERINVGRKPGNPLTVGMKLEGHLEDDQRGNGKKLVMAGQGGGGGGGRRDPVESARIVRQHSQEMALRYAAIKGKTDIRLDDDFRKVIDWFAADAKAATP